MTSLNVCLPEPLWEFVEQQVSQHRYGGADEFIRSLIQDAQRREAEARVDGLLLDGLDSGEPTPMTPHDWSRIRQAVQAQAASSP